MSKNFEVEAQCRDCQMLTGVPPREFNCASAPRCPRCGGMLDASYDASHRFVPYKPPRLPARSADVWFSSCWKRDGTGDRGVGAYGYAVVSRHRQKQILARDGVDVGRCSCHEVAYKGLIAALDAALAHALRKVTVRTDDETIFRQLTGKWACHRAEIQPLIVEARDLLRTFDKYSVMLAKRTENHLAKASAKRAMRAMSTRSAPAATPT